MKMVSKANVKNNLWKRNWMIQVSRSTFAVSAMIASLMWGAKASATDLSWGGHYRFEGVKIINSELSGQKSDKSYMLQHLVLNPKLVAADGLTIYSRLDVLNSSNFGLTADGQLISVAGDVIGNGPGIAAPTRGTDSNAWGRTQRPASIAVSSLYLSWAQEFGQLVVGRAPLHFGLGTAFNAGNGLFDHFIDTRDMVAYKMVFGNLSLMPIMGKVSEGNLGQEDEVDDYIFQMQYENPDTELALGVLYDIHIVTGNDMPAGPLGTAFWGAGSTNAPSFKNTLMSFFFTQKATSWLRAAVEADFLSGDTGVLNSAGNMIALNAFGVAGEFSYIAPAESKWGANVKVGLATGDEPVQAAGAKDVYGGFAFNRNYDVGLLMFNHPLGRTGVDFLRTGMIRDTSVVPSSQIDNEAISNAIYLAPNVSYRLKDNLTFGGTFVYAMLNKDPLAGSPGTSKNLGYEVDLSVSYKPMERFTWITEGAVLLPGEAWRGGSNGFDNQVAYGIVTKAAIRF